MGTPPPPSFPGGSPSPSYPPLLPPPLTLHPSPPHSVSTAKRPGSVLNAQRAPSWKQLVEAAAIQICHFTVGAGRQAGGRQAAILDADSPLPGYYQAVLVWLRLKVGRVARGATRLLAAVLAPSGAQQGVGWGCCGCWVGSAWGHC